MTAVLGRTVGVPTQDGTADAYFSHPDDNTPHPTVLLYMDAFGVRPQLRKMADRLAGAGYTVLVPNVFHRHGPAPVVPLPDFIASADRQALVERILPIMGELTQDLVVRDAESYLAWLAARPETADGPVGVSGYCMGARLALLTAAGHPERVAAVAGFHGGRLAFDGDPESPHLLAGRITAELYLGHADHDRSMTPEDRERLDKVLDAADVRHRTEVYRGAEHGYSMADTDAYDADATERHWAALLDLLGRNL
ncbi:dienelactone hydrolase family protein [Streptomyces bobili]|uniref:dienelactone hydrolase family protein n=1 Tax=Streptomyces bobili TaxID=67280 RepID=UPI0036FA4778